MLFKIIFSLLLFNFLTPFFIGSHCDGQYRLGTPLEENTIITLTSSKGILYSGIDNYLKINKELLDTIENCFLVCNNGFIVPDSLRFFLIVPERPGKVRITAKYMMGIDTVMVGFQYFTVLGIPEPRMTLNTMPITTPIILPKKVLLECDSLGVFFSEDIPGSEYWMKITEFTIGYNYGGFHISHVNLTNRFSDETVSIINRLGPDREISIWPVVEAIGKVKKNLPIYRIKIY